MCTKFYHNRLGFVEDITKTFGVFFGSQCTNQHNPSLGGLVVEWLGRQTHDLPPSHDTAWLFLR